MDLLGGEAIVHVLNTLAQLVHRTGGLQRCDDGFRGLLTLAYTSGLGAQPFDLNAFSVS
jgi:hypothetical protein